MVNAFINKNTCQSHINDKLKTSLNYLEWPLTTFHGHGIIQRQITKKRYKKELYLQWRTNIKSYMVYWKAPFSMTWTTPTAACKIMLFIDAEYLRNGTRYRRSFNEILIGTYTRPTQRCHFEWQWVTLSDITKYSMTRSIARPLCDSRPTCSY